MSAINSLLKIYGIREIFIKEDERIEIVIEKREQNLTLNRWINFINSLKQIYKKEIDFLLKDEAIKIYGSLDNFAIIKE